MNRFAFATLFRSLTRHKLYAALNIGGLAVGIAVFLVLSLYAHHETSFERWLPEHEKIYLVQTEWTTPDQPYTGVYPQTMGGLLEQLKGDFPALVGTRVQETNGSVVRNEVATGERIAQVDPQFFELFALPMATGDGAPSIDDPSVAVISEGIARKYFASLDVIGQTISLDTGDGTRPYRIVEVFRGLPAATDFDFSIITRLPEGAQSEWWYNWGSTSLLTFLKFDSRAQANQFEEQLPAFVTRHGSTNLGPNAAQDMRLPLLPLAERHFQPVGRESDSQRLTVLTLSIVGILTLLIAIVNYVNLATARAGLRAREVAMRKVLGAKRSTLVRQFMSEAMLTVAIAALVGLVLAELGLPLVNAAGGLSIAMPYGLVVPALIVLVVLVGGSAGFYPALVLSKFPAASVLASARSPGGGRSGSRVREALVVLQFSLAIAFIVGTVVMIAQTQHVRNADVGFDRENVIIVSSFANASLDESQRAALLTRFSSVPAVRVASIGDSAAGGTGLNNTDQISVPGRPGPDPSLRRVATGPRFFEVYSPRLIAGRLLGDAYRLDDSTGLSHRDHRNIVINKRAVSALGFKSPEEAIGQTVGGPAPRTVVGVIDDLRFFSPRLPIDPTYYTYYRDTFPYPVASLRVSGDVREATNAVQAEWQQIVPQIPFDASTAELRLQEFYESDDRTMRLFSIGAILAILIGCVGLWGLASFNTTRRVREIGIRKTLGASSGDIIRLLVGQFLRPVLLANLLAWPLAYLALRHWLAGFDDRIALSVTYFLIASGIAAAIAVLTVMAQSLRAARAEPAWALRHD